MKRIGIYGGTFDPPHLGHIRAAQFAYQALGLSKLLLIPSCRSPHKDPAPYSPTPQQRMDMLQLAVDGLEVLEPCDLELQRGGVSYTYETVLQLKERYPDAELILCMGSDMFQSFQNWKNPGEILKNASLAVFCRGHKEEVERIAARKTELEQAGFTVYELYNPVTMISSTDLRRLACFGCTDALLPKGVGAYIRENHLYGCGANLKQLPTEQLEQVVVKLLKPNRVAHVLGCRQTAVELAKRWGADEENAARAGLLHDITKALDGPLQLTLCHSYGSILSDFSRQNPKTLHALTGSLVAKYIFGENDAVVSAIESHTTGKGNMNTLEKIIYVADYMEPNRDFPGVELLRHYAHTDLDMALETGLEMTLTMLREQGKEISRESLEALNYLKAQKG